MIRRLQLVVRAAEELRTSLAFRVSLAFGVLVACGASLLLVASPTAAASKRSFSYRVPPSGTGYRVRVDVRSLQGSAVALESASDLHLVLKPPTKGPLELRLWRFALSTRLAGRPTLAVTVSSTSIEVTTPKRRLHRTPANDKAAFARWFGDPLATVTFRPEGPSDVRPSPRHPALNLGGAALLRFWLLAHPLLPARPPRVGSSWTKRLDIPRGQGLTKPLVVPFRFTAEKTERCGRAVCLVVRIEAGPIKRTVKLGTPKTPVVGDVEYSFRGRTRLELKSGLLHQAEIETRVLVTPHAQYQSLSQAITTKSLARIERMPPGK